MRLLRRVSQSGWHESYAKVQGLPLGAAMARPINPREKTVVSCIVGFWGSCLREILSVDWPGDGEWSSMIFWHAEIYTLLRLHNVQIVSHLPKIQVQGSCSIYFTGVWSIKLYSRIICRATKWLSGAKDGQSCLVTTTELQECPRLLALTEWPF